MDLRPRMNMAPGKVFSYGNDTSDKENSMSSQKKHQFQVFSEKLYLNSFYCSAVIYFLSLTLSLPSLVQMVLKIMPMLCLLKFVHIHAAPGNVGGHVNPWAIMFGLGCSSVGDIVLVWNHMISGICAFAVAHCAYIHAFGFKELKLQYAVVLYAFSMYVTAAVIKSFPPEHVLRNFVPVYALLLATMGWRALALLHKKGSRRSFRILVAVGAILFIISDTLLAIDEFVHRIPYAHVIVMSTYYTGQYGIACSVLL